MLVLLCSAGLCPPRALPYIPLTFQSVFRPAVIINHDIIESLHTQEGGYLRQTHHAEPYESLGSQVLDSRERKNTASETKTKPRVSDILRSVGGSGARLVFELF